MNTLSYNARVKNGAMCIIMIAVAVIALLAVDIVLSVLRSNSIDELGIENPFYLFVSLSYTLFLFFYRWYHGKKYSKIMLGIMVVTCIALIYMPLAEAIRLRYWDHYTALLGMNVIVLVIIVLMLLFVGDINVYMKNQRVIINGESERFK